MEKSITIFGVSLRKQSKAEILKQFEAGLDGRTQRIIVTPNPEMLVLARGNKLFRETLNNAAIQLIDGFGLVLAVRLFFGVKLERYTGVSAVRDIVALAAQKDKKIFILGGNEAVLEKLIAAWSHKFPDLQIMGTVGPRVVLDKQKENGFFVDDIENKKVIQLIQDFVPDVLLVGFGHGKQELWLSSMLPVLSSVRLAMGVGGSFDYLSGMVSRAPCWMRTIGLEWLYRLACEPRRIKRIFKAVVLFPICLLKERFKLGYFGE